MCIHRVLRVIPLASNARRRISTASTPSGRRQHSNPCQHDTRRISGVRPNIGSIVRVHTKPSTRAHVLHLAPVTGTRKRDVGAAPGTGDDAREMETLHVTGVEW